MGALDTPLISAEVDTDGLINAAIENKEVAWDDCLRLRNVVLVGAELSDVGLTDLLLQRKKYYFYLVALRQTLKVLKYMKHIFAKILGTCFILHNNGNTMICTKIQH